ncbi:hypothetical protein H5410_062037, partial [Solanum commersonii]
MSLASTESEMGIDYSYQQRSSGPAPSSTSEPTPRPRNGYKDRNMVPSCKTPSYYKTRSMSRNFHKGTTFGAHGSQSRFYGLYSPQDEENSPDVVAEHFYVSNTIGESMLSNRMYRIRTISLLHKDTTIDLVELDI